MFAKLFHNNLLQIDLVDKLSWTYTQSHKLKEIITNNKSYNKMFETQMSILFDWIWILTYNN